MSHRAQFIPDNTLAGTFETDDLFSLITTFTVTNGTATITFGSAHGLSAGNKVQFTSTGTLPAPLSAYTTYYVLAAGLTTTQCEVAATSGGTAITFTNTGTGTHTGWKQSSTLITAPDHDWGRVGLYLIAPDDLTGGGAPFGGDVILQDAFISHAYSEQWTVGVAFTISLYSGTMPPGLSVSQPTTTSFKISGTPPVGSTLTTYDFTLRTVIGADHNDVIFHITLYDDPDEGVGFASGF